MGETDSYQPLPKAALGFDVAGWYLQEAEMKAKEMNLVLSLPM